MKLSSSVFDPKLADFNTAEIQQYQIKKLQEILERVYNNSPYYKNKFDEAGIKPGDIKTIEDLANIPFTTKEELRLGYPLGLMAVPEDKVVRIHSSSGTTGKPIIIPYTQKDVDNWAVMMSRCMAMVGITNKDRVQVTPGYGLWTAGIGFQAGAERLGAMVIPTGPGNTEKQLEMMVDMQTTVLIGTASYGLLLAEEINRRGIKDKINLRIGIFGSERWGNHMRQRIESLLNIETFDIYGLTEIYGPGIGIDCPEHTGMHYWWDHLLFEIIDPNTGEQLPQGEQGELVITTLTKEGMPLIRFRTRDITRILKGQCPCGLNFPRIEKVLGRTDDRIKVKGVNIYPGQLECVIDMTEGASSEYQLIITRQNAKDHLLIKIEVEPKYDADHVAQQLQKNIKTHIGITTEVEGVPLGTLPRTTKKSKRIFDHREY